MFRIARVFLKGDMSWATLHDGNPQWGAPYSQMDRKLRDDEFADFLKSVKGWRVTEEGGLDRTFVFPDHKISYEWIGRVMAFSWWTDKFPTLTITGNECHANIFSGRFQGITHKEARLAAFMGDQAHILRKVVQMAEQESERKPTEFTLKTHQDTFEKHYASPPPGVLRHTGAE